MFENNKNQEEVIDLSRKFHLYGSGDDETEIINILEAIIKSTSDFSYFEKIKLLKEIQNLRNGNTEKFLDILVGIDLDKKGKILHGDGCYIYGNDDEKKPVKIRSLDMFGFVDRLGKFYSKKTSNTQIQDEYDIFVENVLNIIKQNRNPKGDYYNYFKGRSEIWQATTFDSPEDVKRILIDLYVQSRLNEKNEKLDKELPFLSFNVLLNKYNEQVQEKAKKSGDETKYIEKYGVETIIKEGNNIIKDKLINNTLFSCLDSPDFINFESVVDLYRATEYMSISEIVSIFKKNIENYNRGKKLKEEMIAEDDKYGIRNEQIEELEHYEKEFDKFKSNRLPRIVNILKNRLIKEGLVNKSIDANLLSAKICSELLDVDGVYGDYSKEDDIDLESIISQNDYLVNKKQFESLTPFGILKIKQKQNQLGMPRHARLF